MNKGINGMADSASNLGEILKNSIESMKDIAGVSTIIGDPINTPSGTIIIPVSKVSMGIASGGLDYGKGEGTKVSQSSEVKRNGRKNFGGGGGTGITITPVSFLVISASGDVEILNVGADMPPAGPVESMANLIEKSPDILSRLKNVISGFKSGKDNDKGENVTAEGAPEKDL